MHYEFMDAVLLDSGSVNTSKDGYMTARARVARSGVQVYSGASVGKPEMALVRVFRPESEVFDDAAMRSMANRPVTINHPKEFVTSKNWDGLAKGMTGGKVVRDGDYVVVDLAVMDEAAIEAIKSGKRQLSAGYNCELEFTAGRTADGSEYDAIQRGIRVNHLAVVDMARAGPECRIGDSLKPAKQEEKQMADRKITVDGFTIEVSDQAAQAIEKLSAKVNDAEKKAADAVKALDAKDGEMAALKKTSDDKIAELTKQLADSEASLDARLAERQAVIDAATKVAGKAIDAKGKTTADIRRAAVVAALGDAAVKDRSDEYVTASFDTLVAAKPLKDALGQAVSASVTGRANDAVLSVSDAEAARDAGYNEYLRSLRGETKEAK